MFCGKKRRIEFTPPNPWQLLAPTWKKKNDSAILNSSIFRPIIILICIKFCSANWKKQNCNWCDLCSYFNVKSNHRNSSRSLSYDLKCFLLWKRTGRSCKIFNAGVLNHGRRIGTIGPFFKRGQGRNFATTLCLCQRETGETKKVLQLQRPQGWSCPPGVNFVVCGWSCPLGVKFFVPPSILLNSSECSPLGDKFHPWGPGVKLRVALGS
jgi:hypothetical protein